MQQNSSNSKVIKRKKVSVYTRKLKDGEVVPMVVDRAFKRVFADENHLERLNLLLGVVLNKKVNVIRILNNELIGRSRKTRKRAVDLVCEVEDYGLCNIEVNSALKWSRERNFGYLCRVIGEDDYLDVSEDEADDEEYTIYIDEADDEDDEGFENAIQINFNITDTNNKHYVKIGVFDEDDLNFRYTERLKIININVDYYKKLCYTKDENELSLFERVVGALGIDNLDALYKIAGNDSVLKEIGDAVKKYRNDDNIVYMYDAEKAMKRAYMYDLRYEVKEAVKKAEEQITKDVTDRVTKEVTKEVTKKTTLELAKRLKESGVSVDIIKNTTGLSQEQINKL